MNKIIHNITNGFILSEDSEVVKTARRFMKENGYKISESGKRVAISDLMDLDYPLELKSAVSLAIVNL